MICLTQICFTCPVNILLHEAGSLWLEGASASGMGGVSEWALTDHMTREGLLGPERICFPPASSGSPWVWVSHHLTTVKFISLRE